MRIVSFVAGIFLGMVAGSALAAENALDLLDSRASYTADFTVSGDKGTYTGTVWHVQGRERRDFTTREGGQAVILRRDTNSAYLLKPSGRWYVGLSLAAVGALAGGLDSLSVERTKMGSDRIAGLAVTKYKVRGSGPKGSRFDGLAWFSADNILVRAEGDITEPSGKTSQVMTELSRLRLGAVDEQVFDVPAGWMGMDLRSVPPEKLAGAIEGMKMLLERK